MITKKLFLMVIWVLLTASYSHAETYPILKRGHVSGLNMLKKDCLIVSLVSKKDTDIDFNELLKERGYAVATDEEIEEISKFKMEESLLGKLVEVLQLSPTFKMGFITKNEKGESIASADVTLEIKSTRFLPPDVENVYYNLTIRSQNVKGTFEDAFREALRSHAERLPRCVME